MPGNDRIVRVLIADDHPLLRDGIRRELEATEGLDLVGTVPDGAEALSEIRRLRPDVALLDLDMPRIPGLEVLKAILAEGIPTRVLILTGSTSNEVVVAAMTAGASGYLLKSADWDEVARAVKTVADGGTVVDPSLLGTLAGALQRRPDGLSSGELDVLRLASRKTASEIGLALHLSEGTVRKRLSSIYAKLEVRSKAEAVSEAVRRGLIA